MHNKVYPATCRNKSDSIVPARMKGLTCCIRARGLGQQLADEEVGVRVLRQLHELRPDVVQDLQVGTSCCVRCAGHVIAPTGCWQEMLSGCWWRGGGWHLCAVRRRPVLDAGLNDARCGGRRRHVGHVALDQAQYGGDQFQPPGRRRVLLPQLLPEPDRLLQVSDNAAHIGSCDEASMSIKLLFASITSGQAFIRTKAQAVCQAAATANQACAAVAYLGLLARLLLPWPLGVRLGCDCGRRLFALLLLPVNARRLSRHFPTLDGHSITHSDTTDQVSEPDTVPCKQ